MKYLLILILFLPGGIATPAVLTQDDSYYQNHLPSILHSIQLKTNGIYSLHPEGIIDTKVIIPMFQYYLQTVLIRQSLVDLRNYPDMRVLPDEVKTGLVTELNHHYVALNDMILKIDNGLSLYWNQHFQKDISHNFNQTTLNETTVPRLYNRSIILDTRNYLIPNHSITKIQGMKVDNLIDLSLKVQSGKQSQKFNLILNNLNLK